MLLSVVLLLSSWSAEEATTWAAMCLSEVREGPESSLEVGAEGIIEPPDIIMEIGSVSPERGGAGAWACEPRAGESDGE